MKNNIQSIALFTLLFLGQLHLVAQGTLQHTVTASNRSSNSTKLDHPFFNGKQNLVLFATADYGTAVPQIYTPEPIGVKYDGTHWTIFNQKTTVDMPVNAKYNVVAYQMDTSFLLVHTTTAVNTPSYYTTLNHPALNDIPTARFIVTQRYGAYNPNSISVTFANGRWRILNQNMASMPINTQFNVYINTCSLIEATAPAINTTNYFAIDNNFINGAEYGTLFLTQIATSVTNNREVGVWYNNAKWHIVNQDLATMPSQAKFFVWGSRGVYQPTSCNTLKIAQLTSLSKSIDTLYGFTLSDSLKYGITGCYASAARDAYNQTIIVKNTIKEFIAWNTDDVVTYAEAAQWNTYFDKMVGALSAVGNWARISAIYHGSCEGYKAAILSAQLESRMSDLKQQSSKCYMDAYLDAASCRTTGLKGTLFESKTNSNIMLKVSPNPTNQTVTIYFEMPITGETKLDITNLQGQVVKQFLKQILPIGQKEFSYTVSDLPEGIYFVGCSVEGTNIIERQKLVIVR